MDMEQGTRARLTTVLILLLVLATGSVLGVAVDRVLKARNAVAEEVGPNSPDEEERPDSERREGSSENRRRLIVESVGLTDRQKIQVDSIVSHYRHRMRELQGEMEEEVRRAYFPRYRELMENTREEIKGVLTPAQQVEYDSLLADYDRHRREERSNRTSGSDSEG